MIKLKTFVNLLGAKNYYLTLYINGELNLSADLNYLRTRISKGDGRGDLIISPNSVRFDSKAGYGIGRDQIHETISIWVTEK